MNLGVVVVQLVEVVGERARDTAHEAAIVPEEFFEARSHWMDFLDGPRVLNDEAREEGEDEVVKLFSGDRLFSSEEPIDECLDLWA